MNNLTHYSPITLKSMKKIISKHKVFSILILTRRQNYYTIKKQAKSIKKRLNFTQHSPQSNRLWRNAAHGDTV